jgi:hypothetical protein
VIPNGPFVIDQNRWDPYQKIGCIVPPKLEINLFKYLPTPDTKSFHSISPYNAEGAETAIKKAKTRILFPGGFGGMPDFSSPADKAFQTKYDVEFFSQGCVHSGENENEAAYNQVVFKYLDKKYGKAWRYELRDDAIGFDAPEPLIKTQEIKEAAILPIQIGGTKYLEPEAFDPETETSILWYILPTSGFALLLSLYFIIRQKKKK